MWTPAEVTKKCGYNGRRAVHGGREVLTDAVLDSQRESSAIYSSVQEEKELILSGVNVTDFEKTGRKDAILCI